MPAAATAVPAADSSKPATFKKTAVHHKDRSPNFPSITFMDALEKVKKIYEAERNHTVSRELAAKHMGFVFNGRTRMYLAALKQYGLLVSVGEDVQVTEDAIKLLVYPKDEPKRAALIRQLAMQPKTFQAVVAKWGMDLPSDANLAAFLRLELKFTEDACPTMIKVLKHAIGLADAVAGVDAKPPPGDTPEENASGDAPMTGFLPSANDVPPPKIPPPPPVGQKPMVAGQQERHVWKLGGGAWAEVTVTGTLTTRRLEKLKGFIALLDAEDDAGGQPE